MPDTTTRPPLAFTRAGSLSITYSRRDRMFICWRPHCSQAATTRKEVLAFARWPASTPTGQALRDWLDLLLADAAATAAAELTAEQQALAAATGFGPEQHEADEPVETDPTAHTRTVI